MADPDLELRGGGGGGLDLLAMAAIFPSFISSLFTQNKGGSGPPPRSATDSCVCCTLCCSFYIQVEQELWHTLCVSITLTWKSQCVNCSQFWMWPIIFVQLQTIAPIKETFLMWWAISFSPICLRLICIYYAVFYMIGQKKNWAWYSQMCSSVCLQVFHFVVSKNIPTITMEGCLVRTLPKYPLRKLLFSIIHSFTPHGMGMNIFWNCTFKVWQTTAD